MTYQLTPEQEKELIEKIAKYVVDNGYAEFIYPLYDYCLKYWGNLIVQLGMLWIFPFMGLAGTYGTDFAIFLETDARTNLGRLIDRVRELDEDKKKEEAAKRALEEKKPRKTFSKRVKSLFSKKKETA